MLIEPSAGESAAVSILLVLGCDTSGADLLDDEIVKETKPEMADVSEDWDW